MTTTTSTSLTLRALFKEALVRGGLSGELRDVSGLSAAAKALVVAGAAAESLAMLVVPADRDVEPMVSDLRFFLSALEGVSDADAEHAVLAFPSQEVDPYRGLALHFDVASARARALHALAAGRARVVVASAAALLPRVPPPARFLRAATELTLGAEIGPSELADLLLDAGYSREDPVDEHGEFCTRGGVVDFFPAGEAYPIRLEFLGDSVESIRRFDPATQRSVETLDRASVVPLRERFLEDEDAGERTTTSFFQFWSTRPRHRLFVSEHEQVVAHGSALDAQIRSSYADAIARADTVRTPEELIVAWDEVAAQLAGAATLEELSLSDAGLPGAPPSPGHVVVACQPATAFHGRITDWVAEVRRARERHETVVCVMGSPGRSERLIELAGEYDLIARSIDHAESLQGAAVLVAQGHLSRGFRLPNLALQVFAEADLFDDERARQERRRSVTRTFLSDFRDLKVGDHVVHVDHGIGVFVGLKKLVVATELQEFMELRYADDHKLFVPLDRLDLVQKYTGGARPTLDRLGGTTWERAKTRVRKAMRDMAGELLKLYAARKAMVGHAFTPDTHWQEEFEAAFEYDLTPDQDTAVADIKRDMEAQSPMDRLLCGDVGYGKTEVAIRAAFKAVMDGKQVALLAPTTVLALQHLKTFRGRFAAFPVRIDMVSRFRSRAEQKQTVADLAEGKVDVIIGTHRLLSKDVQFRDLGLLVVDEEQRFGVAHKERIKQMRRRVDALAMSATPIPRTLNMSLVGIRDMSVIETPPRDRLSIQTHVVKFDQRVLASAIRHETERGGQIYFVHNRVESIYSMANLITRLVPDVRVAVGHGQMGEDELEKVMVDFIERKYDVLVATTIIENGLDIPNANTIVVNRADRYGLAQLYQLRGRVGRSDRRAYAYLLVPPEDALSPIARRRLAAINEFSDLGSGFRVAALDLEIRGAGNLLGGEQSGHIESIGFEMYMKLLEETVRELKGEELEDDLRATVNLQVDLRIDDEYVPDMNQRLTVYRRMASAKRDEDIDRVMVELRDRYGPVPASVLNLAGYAHIRVLADRLRLESIDREGRSVVFKFRPDARVDPARFVKLMRGRADLALVNPTTVTMDLNQAPELLSESAPPKRSGGRPRRSDQSERSWWTGRATAGTVAPGFTKAELLKTRPEDPRAPGGLFERVRAVLVELGEDSPVR